MFGLCTLVGIATQEWFMTLLSLGLTVIAVYELTQISGMTKNATAYQPGKGFRYYCRTVQQKLRYLTWGQWFLAAI